MPLLLGTVSEEALPFIYQAARKPLTESLYVLATAYLFNIDMVSVYSPTRVSIQASLGVEVDSLLRRRCRAPTQVLRRYPVGGIWDNSDYRPLLAELGTDYIFTCLTRGIARKVSSLGS